MFVRCGPQLPCLLSLLLLALFAIENKQNCKLPKSCPKTPPHLSHVASSFRPARAKSLKSQPNWRCVSPLAVRILPALASGGQRPSLPRRADQKGSSRAQRRESQAGRCRDEAVDDDLDRQRQLRVNAAVVFLWLKEKKSNRRRCPTEELAMSPAFVFWTLCRWTNVCFVHIEILQHTVYLFFDIEKCLAAKDVLFLLLFLPRLCSLVGRGKNFARKVQLIVITNVFLYCYPLCQSSVLFEKGLK